MCEGGSEPPRSRKSARSFVVIARSADASGGFRLDDLAGSSGRFDAAIRCVQSALLVSQGIRRDTSIYLVLLGGEHAPRTVRVRGATAKYLRADERPLATLLKKALMAAADAPPGVAFEESRLGVAVVCAGLEAALGDLGAARLFLLDEGGEDLRSLERSELEGDTAFLVGDPLGVDDATRDALLARGARPVSVGPVSLHGGDAIALVHGELDRLDAQPCSSARSDC